MKEIHRTVRAAVALAVVAAAAVLIAPAASAASGTAVGTLTPSPVLAGTTSSYTFTLRTTSGQASSFNLTAPSGWSIGSVDSSSQPGVSPASSTQIQGRGITVSSSTTLTVMFTATAPCATSASTTWVLAAKSGGNFTGSGFAIDSTGLSTPLSGNCTVGFVPGRGPTDSAFVNGVTQNISSVAYTPDAAAIQTIVNDAAGNPRSGISVSLNLSANPTSAVLSSPTVVSGSGTNGPGLAAFSPVTVSKSGLKYQITPNAGTGVTQTASGFFGVYQEEQACNGSCTAHGNSNTIHSTVTANSQVGTLAVLVSGVAADLINCAGTVPTGYSYQPVSSEVTSWQFTGTGTQTVMVLVDKSLIKAFTNRGSSHIDFCYLVEGFDTLGNPKTFTDKFGVVTSGPGLLPDCDSTITNNCIVSETGVNGGDRLITVTVDDGKGRP
jgi:hypothetical protein